MAQKRRAICACYITVVFLFGFLTAGFAQDLIAQQQDAKQKLIQDIERIRKDIKHKQQMLSEQRSKRQQALKDYRNKIAEEERTLSRLEQAKVKAVLSKKKAEEKKIQAAVLEQKKKKQELQRIERDKEIAAGRQLALDLLLQRQAALLATSNKLSEELQNERKAMQALQERVGNAK